MQSNFFLIGSGFTHSVFPEAPLNTSLMQKMIEEYHGVWESLADRYSCDDVEIALTKLDLELMAEEAPFNKNDPDKMRLQAEKDLAEFFYQFSISKAPENHIEWMNRFACLAFHQGDVVVSLNYDCLIEGLLDNHQLWSPNGGYGSFSYASASMAECEKSPIKVLKIHGSSNFFRRGNSTPGFVTDEFLFPHSSQGKQYCSIRNGDNPALIAPSFVKQPTKPLISLMCESLDAVSLANNFIIIGCGLRPEDGFLMLLLNSTPTYNLQMVKRYDMHPSWEPRMYFSG